MKTMNSWSEAQLLAWQEEMTTTCLQLREAIIPLTKDDVLTESEVCTLLGVTDRTLRKYRQRHYIGFVKMSGRIFYFKHLLYADLHLLYYKSAFHL